MESEKKQEKKKIVILGGGISALTTAFMLTGREGWQNEYDIVLYQIGWRLGGKGASGRNMEKEYSYRIEEHGPHVFFGFYDNVFRMLRTCYKELDRPVDAPLATLDQALVPHGLSILTENIQGEWHLWPFWPPRTLGEPGDHPQTFPPLHHYVVRMMEGLLGMFKGSGLDQDSYDGAPVHAGVVSTELRLLAKTLEVDLGESLLHPRDFLYAAALLADLLRKDSGQSIQTLLLEGIIKLFRYALDMIWLKHQGAIESTSEARKIWVFLNFGYGVLNGAVQCKVFDKGLESINDQDFAEWLGQYVRPDVGLTAGSAVVRWIYDGVFAYLGGDPARPSLEAGSAVLANLRMFLTYRNAVYFKMQSGMGDVVFAPLYQVLAKRGVRFEFFHRVLNLGLSPDKKRVRTIRMQRQATVKEGPGYQPLVEIKGLPCWPSTPLYEQLVEGEELRRKGIDLESYSPQWPGIGPPIDVELGEGDKVVLGISLGALPCVCGELIAASPTWQKMIGAVQTVCTQAFQIWLKPTMSQMGWPNEKEWRLPALTTYDLPVNPINSWIDTSQVLPTEGWPASGDAYPQTIGYFCAPLIDGPAADHCDPDPRLSEVKKNAVGFLQNHFATLLPGVGGPAGDFKWHLLVDNRQPPGRGSERFDAQFWISIHNPSDRYVMTVPGSSQYRLQADDPSFENLFPTGDWIYNTFNVGCAEAATMSGMATANAVLGQSVESGIIGWGIGQPEVKI